MDLVLKEYPTLKDYVFYIDYIDRYIQFKVPESIAMQFDENIARKQFRDFKLERLVVETPSITMPLDIFIITVYL